MYLRLFPHIFFFFNDTATTEIYTLSLHDALPIWGRRAERDRRPALRRVRRDAQGFPRIGPAGLRPMLPGDRKSTRLNSSHSQISYAVFCLKKKKKKQNTHFNNHVARPAAHEHRAM